MEGLEEVTAYHWCQPGRTALDGICDPVTRRIAESGRQSRLFGIEQRVDDEGKTSFGLWRKFSGPSCYSSFHSFSKHQGQGPGSEEAKPAAASN